MGKFKHSELHSRFSDWHWKKCKRDALLCDVDRIWVEMRNSKPKAVFDLKWGNDSLSPTARQLAEWFESQGIPFYIVEILESFQTFNIYRPKTDALTTLNEAQMIEWINNDLPLL